MLDADPPLIAARAASHAGHMTNHSARANDEILAREWADTVGVGTRVEVIALAVVDAHRSSAVRRRMALGPLRAQPSPRSGGTCQPSAQW